MATTFELHPIGRARSPIHSRAQAPKQGDEGAPETWLEIDSAVAEAARDLHVGQEVVLLTLSDARQCAEAATPGDGLRSRSSSSR